MVWYHGGSSSGYQLSMTLIGRALPCQSEDKHPCFKLGSETFLCISEELACDGIRHCPTGIGYLNDEDTNYCEQKRKRYYQEMKKNLSIWEQISMEAFLNVFKNEPEVETTTEMKFNEDERTTTQKGFIEYKKKSYSNGLSRYGPWGYLMLGMLLCGTSLLVCGLWECCCRRYKLEADTGTIPTEPHAQIQRTASTITAPPNYDEIEAPPSYTVLFPTIPNLIAKEELPNDINIEPTLSEHTTTTITTTTATSE